MNKKETQKMEAVDTLEDWGVTNGTLIHAKVNSVSRSGMSRRVSLYFITEDGRLVDISYWSAKALGWGYKDGYAGGISVGGCGMDMLLHTVDCLSYAMGYGSLNQGAEGSKKGLRCKAM